MASAVDEWSPVELLALVEGLPPASRFIAHVQGGDRWRDYWGWGKDRHMFADLIDIFVSSKTDNKKKPWSYPRPGAQQKSKQPSMGEFLRAAARSQGGVGG